jgi:carbamoyl-phosphate synthase large subunit
VPNFAVPSDFSDAESARRTLGGGFVVRSRIAKGRPATGLPAATQADWSTLDDDSFLQEEVAGPAYKVVVYRPADGKGRVSTALEEVADADGERVTHRLRGGDSVTALERVGQATVRALGVTGPAEVSIRRRADGTLVVLNLDVGFGRHTQLVPEVLASVLHDHRMRPTRGTAGGAAAPDASVDPAMETVR